MKYYESPKKFPKFVGSAGFYTVIALCLIALGAVSWFAISRYNAATENPQSSVESPASDAPYSSGEGHIDDIQEEPSDISENSSSVITETSQENVPYEEPQEAVPDTQSFIAPAEGNISKDYSDTVLQYSKTYGDMRLHTGIDILCDAGTEIKSAGNGTVKAIEDNSSLGKCITIDHGNGIVIKYCGFDTVAVSESEQVTTGRAIGALGAVPAECADESHLHLEVTKDGKSVSPLKILGLE